MALGKLGRKGGIGGLGRLGGTGGYSPVTALGTDLIAYWDAGRADLITQASTLVSSWKDIVAAYDMAQATGAAQGVYSATGFNGDPAISLDGIDDCFTCTDAALLAALPIGAVGSELWVLAGNTALAADTSIRSAVTYGGTSSTNARQVSRTVVTAVNRGRVSVGDGATEMQASGAIVDLSTRHVLRGAIGAASTPLTIDGTADGTLTVVPSTAILRARIGATAATAAARFWQGPVAAVLITKPLSAPKAAGLQTYLLNRRKL